jgi:aspartyl-tRNA(Asn)/glutamyl-tRNA(Gln) amidotransferase subunit A
MIWTDLAAIGRGFRSGAFSPGELMQMLLERIERLDPILHAVLHIDPQKALDAAADATEAIGLGNALGPLHGIPIGIKDIIDVRGMPTTCHSRLMSDQPVAEDAAVVARLRVAGAIPFAKLATHEFAIGGPAFDLPFPPARNPWNVAHHPGGSSSGSGAGVAAGLFPAAIGTDTAGSARNPASACGIVGLKPTYGLVSRRGVFPLAFSMDHVCPMTRSVADAALMLEVMAGYDQGDRGSANRVPLPCSADLDRGVRGLRIGVVRHFHEIDMRADAETAAAFERVAATLEAEGATLREIILPSLNDFANINRIILQAEGFAIHANNMRARPEAYSKLTRKALLAGAFLGAEDYIAASRRRAQMIAEVDAAFGGVDVLLTASSMEPACRIDDDAEIARTYMLQARTPFNLTGHPALAMMSGLSSHGLPLSVQFVSRYWDETTLCRAAAGWERAMGGPQHPQI